MLKINSKTAYSEKFKQSANTSFSGTRTYIPSKQMQKDLAKNLPIFPRLNVFLGKNSNEILNALVTAIGTAFVAPIFIAFNPLSKEDENTKKYSALRQPISAVIAIVTQVAVNLKFDNWIDGLARKGHLKTIDLTAKPNEALLRKDLKKDFPSLSNEEIQEKVNDAMDEAFRPEVTKKREEFSNKEIELKSLICPETYKDERKKLIDELKAEGKKLSSDDLHKKVEERIESNLRKKYEDLKKSIIEGLSEKNIADSEHIAEQEVQAEKAKKLVRVAISNAEERLKNFKKYSGIALALLCLPVSCSILNWSYPRFVEKFFPSLADSKKTKEDK